MSDRVNAVGLRAAGAKHSYAFSERMVRCEFDLFSFHSISAGGVRHKFLPSVQWPNQMVQIYCFSSLENVSLSLIE